jgi:inosine-uridine nucleoside N-ribohydrolase
MDNLKKENEECWIIDTSYNCNDQIIIPYLIKKLNVIAITTVGSSKEHSPQVIKAKIESDLENKYEIKNIPVYAGADRPYINYQEELNDDSIINPYEYIESRYSEEDIQVVNEQHEKNKNDEEIGKRLSNIAAVKIAELSRIHTDKLNIFTLGPLTNVSLAVLIDATLKQTNLVVTGGSYNNIGNSGNCAEYNLRVDPVASKNVFLYYKKLTLIPYELENQLINEEVISSLSSYIPDKLKEDLVSEERTHSILGLISGIIVANPSLKVVKHVRPTDVDIMGRYTRGALVIEKYDYLRSGNFNDITIIEEIDKDSFLEALKEFSV